MHLWVHKWMLARQKRTKGAMVGHLQLTFFSRGSMSYVATYLKQQLTACFWSLLSFLKWLQCAWHLLQILYFCLTDFAVSLLTGRGSLGNREKTWHLSLSSFLPSFQPPHHLPAGASRPAENLERLTGEITGHGCQPWQTGTRLAPIVQYEVQITTEE